MNLKEEKKTIKELIHKYNQTHLLRFCEELTLREQEDLLENIKLIDFSRLKEILKENSTIKVDLSEINPPVMKKKSEMSEEIRLLGEKAIREGKLAIFLLAGGQGSRLGFDGPKGCYPVSPIKKKTLYQLYAEKVLSASRRYDVKLDFYIMTSIATHKETVKYFEENNYFGLDKKQVVFFEQELLPAIDKEGKILLKEKGKVNLVPTGTGTVFKGLYESGLIRRMEKNGIEFFQYLQIDDAIAAVADPIFLGCHMKEQSVYSSKVVEKNAPTEQVGVFVEQRGRLKIVEYIHLPTNIAIKREATGKLVYRAVNVANHIINRKFAKMVATEVDLPFYLANKKIECINGKGEIVKPTEPNAYKLESFSFDALPYAEKTMLMVVKRDDEFAPVKYSEGKIKTPRVAAEQISSQGKRWLEKAGMPKNLIKDLETVEISPLFALDEKDFLKKIKKENFLEAQIKENKKIYIK